VGSETGERRIQECLSCRSESSTTRGLAIYISKTLYMERY
jgi:nitrate reductase cytochrome c-type subunit